MTQPDEPDRPDGLPSDAPEPAAAEATTPPEAPAAAIPAPSPSDDPGQIDLAGEFPVIDEAPQPFWKLAAQFFVFPLLIAGVAVLVYVGVRSLTRTDKGIPELLRDIEYGGRNKKWQAAFSLSAELVRRGKEISPAARDQLILLFDKQLMAPADAEGRGEEERKLVRYLALCLAHLRDPRAGKSLEVGLSSDDAELRRHCVLALGHLQDPRHVSAVAQLLTGPDPDTGVRALAAYALGSLVRVDAPAEARGAADWAEALAQARSSLHRAMTSDGERQVRWNAAVGLAQTGDKRASVLLAKLLDPAFVTEVPITYTVAGSDREVSTPKSLKGEREQAIVIAIQAAVKLGDPGLVPALKKLTDSPSPRIQLKARDALAKLTSGAGK